MTTFIITTVGTSLLENNDINTTGLREKPFSDKKEGDISYDNADKALSQLIGKKESAVDICAEIDSIVKIQQKKNKSVTVYLVCSDTILSPLCAKHIKCWLMKSKGKFQIEDVKFESKYGNHIVKDLCVTPNESDTSLFIKKGIGELIKALSNATTQGKAEFIINITGGYKAIIPIMTMFAQIKKLPLAYTYENSGELIVLENKEFPMSFDWEIAQNAVQFLDDTYLAGGDRNNRPSEDILNQLSTFGLVQKGKKDKYEISALGTMLSAFVKNNPSVGNGTLGLFIEYLLYYHFNERRDSTYHQPSKIDLGLYIYKSKLYTPCELAKPPFSLNSENIKQAVMNWNLAKEKEEKIDTLGDIDLVLRRKDNCHIALCEVKAIGSIRSEAKGIKYRIEGYNKEYKKKPDEFIFIVYDLKYKFETDRSFNEDTNLKRKLATLKEGCPITFRAFGFLINLTDNSLQVNYTSLLKDLTIKLEEIILP